MGAALMLAAAPSSHAVEMVEGGFGADPTAFFEKPSSGLQSRMTFAFDGATALGGFTPRSSGTLFEDLVSDHTVSLSLGIESGWLDRLRQPGFAVHSSMDAAQGMMVGGALQLDSLGVMGGYGRTHLFGSDTDMVAAGLEFGPVRARFAYGPGEAAETGVRDVMMFSTDLVARPWLTLQGDVAFGSREDADDHAMGRVGIKLRF
ncbi:MAG: hypothetical protein KDE35_08450 [Geminicoccaceae bacterium]|nr:hypothetical protein [Geminicoccaceae bacterium]